MTVLRSGREWSGDGGRLSKSLLYHRDQLGAPLTLQVARDLPYLDRDCFALDRPRIVPARTFLSQLA